ncbi:hypothetical protein [Flavobacterium sp.]|uniref:hypothetical protein n=1 Tax=Flavobacterium sp. TaxID=239 RepID=UPI0025D73EA6|nr:hypothetical protein [Flavobacterium sp.]
MDIAIQANYLIFGFKETGDATYLFKLNRVLTEFLEDVLDDYLESDGYEVSKPKDNVLKAINWRQDNTLGTDLGYRVGCQD